MTQQESQRPALSPTSESDIKQEQQQRKGRIFWLKMAAIPLLIGIVIWVVFCRSVPPSISPETTYITEPRLEKRRGVDYYKAIEQRMHTRPMDSDDNGFRLLAQHLPLPNLSQEKQYQVYQQLGLSEKTTPDLKFEEAGGYLYYVIGKEEFWKIESLLYQYPWTLDEYPFMQKWLEDNEAALNLLNEASRKPYFYMPFVKDEKASIYEEFINEMEYYTHTIMRSYTRALNARAHYYIGTGNIDAAIEDKITILRLGRHSVVGIDMVPGLIALAVEGISNSIGICANLDDLPTREQLQRLLEEYQNLPPRVTAETLIENERMKALDFVQHCYLYGFDMKVIGVYMFGATIPDWVNYVNLLGFDYNHVMREVNKSFDTGMSDPFNPMRADLPSLRRRSQQMANAVNQIMGGSHTNSVKAAWNRIECTTNMQMIVLAMLLYHEDHGTLPPAFTIDANGTPLHSWRVLLLPYLGYDELYAKIRLDEPWDSEHNRQFHRESLDVYRCQNTTLGDGETSCTVVVGEKTAFNDSGTGRKLSDFGPKSANLVLLGEMLPARCWMKPLEATWEDAKYSDDYTSPRTSVLFSNAHSWGGNFAFRDGSVRFMSDTMNTDKWNGMLLGVQLEADDVVTLQVIREQEEEARREREKAEREEQERLQLEQWQKEKREREDMESPAFSNEFSDVPFAEPQPMEPKEPAAKNLGRSLIRLFVPQKPKTEVEKKDVEEESNEVKDEEDIFGEPFHQSGGY